MSAQGLLKTVCIVISTALISAPAVSQPLAERVAKLPPNYFSGRFPSGLYLQFSHLPEGTTFFGDVGPNAGCDELDRLTKQVVADHLEDYRAAYVEAVRQSLPANLLSDVDDSRFVIPLENFSPKINKALEPFLKIHAADVLRRATVWATSQGYGGRRLGYNKQGHAFWEANQAMMGICAVPPSSRAQLLRGWMFP